jgi:murein DD-endopeptidase MepM/ murein hydrolase activator NlpD
MPLIAISPPPAPARVLTVSDAQVSPAKTFVGRDPVRIAFQFTGPAPTDLVVEIVSEHSGKIARRFVLRSAVPGTVQRARWDAVTGSGQAAGDGRYRVRVLAAGTRERRRLGAFTLRGHMYPVRGAHADRGGIGSFGAPRNGGRIHEGFDVNAPCGTRLVAARGGLVVRSRYDPALYGNEVIVRGALEGRAYRYAHLRDTPLVKRGDRVRTGQQIGYIGDTGNARSVGCHLHFELRSHNGGLLDPAPFLHMWDRFS